MQTSTTIRFYQRLRILIASKQPSYQQSGEIEANERYFSGVREGKRGRGVAGKPARPEVLSQSTIDPRKTSSAISSTAINALKTA